MALDWDLNVCWQCIRLEDVGSRDGVARGNWRVQKLLPSHHAIDTQYVLLNQAFLIFNFLKIQRVFYLERYMLPIIILVHYY